MLALFVPAFMAMAACGDDDLPEGQEGVAALCAPYRAVAVGFPLDVPPDLNNTGRNLRAVETIETLQSEVAALHDAVRIGGESQVTAQFGRFARETEAALEDAHAGTDGLNTPSDWLPHQEQLNARVESANETLHAELADLGVDLRAECRGG